MDKLKLNFAMDCLELAAQDIRSGISYESSAWIGQDIAKVRDALKDIEEILTEGTGVGHEL